MRNVSVVEPYHRATPAEIFWFEIDPETPPEKIDDKLREVAAKPEHRVSFNELLGPGLLRVYDSSRAAADIDAAFTGFTTNASFLTSYGVDDRYFQERLARLSEEDPLTKAMTPAGLRRVRYNPPCMLDSGIEIGLPEPREQPYRGIIVHLPALFVTSYERKVIRCLECHGWAMIHLDTLRSVRRPNEAAISEANKRRDIRRHELLDAWGVRDPIEFTKNADGTASVRVATPAKEYSAYWKKAHDQASNEIPLPPTGFDPASNSDEDIDASATVIARAVDDALAENAYAAEAALRYVKLKRPDLAHLPVVVLGLSSGALAAPTTVARLGDQCDGAVIIGGGANLLRVGYTSEIASGGLRLSARDHPISNTTLQKLESRYLQQSRLDPYATAPLLAGQPTLVLRAVFDADVPASTGDLLLKRLGNPEHWDFLTGHGIMFWMLPDHAEAIADWLDANIPRAHTGTTESPQ